MLNRGAPQTQVPNQGQIRHTNYNHHPYRRPNPLQNSNPQSNVNNAPVPAPSTISVSAPAPAPAPVSHNSPSQRPSNPLNQQVQSQLQQTRIPNLTFDHITGKPVQTMWTCDICQVKDFQTYEEAVAHEKICASAGGGGQDDSDSNANANTNVYLRSTLLGVVVTATSNGIGSGTGTGMNGNTNVHDYEHVPEATPSPPQNPTLKIHIPPPIEEAIPPGSTKPLMGNCFVCDICKKAYFRTFTEAEYHENLCEQNRDRNIALAAYQVANKKFRAEQAVLAAKRQVEVDAIGVLVGSPLKKKGNPNPNLKWAAPSEVSLQRKSSPEIIVIDSGDEDTKVIPDETKAIPQAIVKRRKKMPLPSKSYVDVLDVPKKTNPDAESAYRSTMEILLEMDFSESRTKDEMLFTDPNLQSVFKHLSPFFQTTFEQFFLTASSDNEDSYISKGYKLVEIKCRYCSHKKSIKDLSKWGIILRNFAMFHLPQSCLHVPSELKDKLSIQQGIHDGSNNTHLDLDKFCDCVAMYYDFVDANKIDSRIASGVFVKSGTIIKKRKEVEEHCSSLPTRQKKINRVKTKVPEHDLMMAASPNKGGPLSELVLYSQDGNTTNLVPFGGVPLLNSFSTKLSSSLRYCQKMLLTNLEIFQEQSSEPAASRPIYLRCQNCNTTTEGWAKKLRSKKDFYKQTMLAHVHFKSCSGTSEKDKETISNVANTFSSSEGDPMRVYCRFLVQAYGLEDNASKKDDTCVVFSNSIYKIGEVSGKNLFLELKSPGLGGDQLKFITI